MEDLEEVEGALGDIAGSIQKLEERGPSISVRDKVVAGSSSAAPGRWLGNLPQPQEIEASPSWLTLLPTP